MNPADDRAMLCGSPDMLKDTGALFEIPPHIGMPGDYVVERAFVAR